MKRNMKAWLNDLMKAPVKQAMPILSFPAIQLMGITVKQLIIDSDAQAAGMKLIADRVPASASVSLMDLSVEAECFGSQIHFSDDEIPNVIGSVVSSRETAEELPIPSIGSGRTGINIDAIRKAAQLITDRPVFAGIIGPYSLAGRLMDVTEIMYYCFDEPEIVHIVLEKVTQFLIDYSLAYKKTGANGIIIAEPLAGLLSPDMIEEFSCTYVKRIVEAVQSDDFIVIYHNCGNTTLTCIDRLLNMGVSAFHFGNAISMADMMPHIPSDTIAMGNVEPAAQFHDGTPASIMKETRRIMEECSGYANFVISSGCDIPPDSKWENIDAFFKAVADFYADPSVTENNMTIDSVTAVLRDAVQ